MTIPIDVVRCVLVAQSIALLLSAVSWWRVWRCPCDLTLKAAAFWTAVVIAQAVVVIGLSVLRRDD